MSQYGLGGLGPQEFAEHPFVTDATGWNERQSSQFLMNGKDQARAMNAGKDQARMTSPRWDQAAARNGQDNFDGGHSVTRAAFWSKDSAQVEENSAQSNWRVHTAARDEECRRKGAALASAAAYDKV